MIPQRDLYLERIRKLSPLSEFNGINQENSGLMNNHSYTKELTKGHTGSK